MLSIKDICQEANISQQTFYRLVRENPDFRTLVESGREKKETAISMIELF